MTHNDVLRSLRYSLNMSDEKFAKIFDLVDYPMPVEELSGYLKSEENDGYVECGDEVIAHFLNALILLKRGRDESRPLAQAEVPVTNNDVLKKIRVAFQLKDTDVLNFIQSAGLNATATEVSAFFRNKNHRNYRDCGDQFLRAVLKGIANK